MQLQQTAAGLIILLIILSRGAACWARTGEEIVSLLDFVEQSDCIFIRNGRQYDAVNARQHIEKKYAYFKKLISTTEDFIYYSATRSSISGKPYRVLCSDAEMRSAEWLHGELDRLRKADRSNPKKGK